MAKPLQQVGRFLSTPGSVRSAKHAQRLESLESRQFFSTSAAGLSLRVPTTDFSHSKGRHIASTHYELLAKSTTATGKVGKHKGGTTASPFAGSATPYGKTPAQIRKAYGVDKISFNGIVGDGEGQTIAIVDAYDNPSFVDSTNANFNVSDLHRFDVQFGLQDPPSFTKVSQTGTKSYPAYNSGWAGEIALDVEWAHAMAPKANILLVEANSSSLSDLKTAVNYAKKQPGVSVISMSYGAAEFSGETAYDSTYTTPTGHTGVTFFASTGDSGAPGSYQAYSPNVVAVGGTSLYLADSSGTYSSEAGWSGSGGGISLYESKPTYQTSSIVTQTSTKRATPDVSMLADPNTGVAILDTSATGIGSAGGWMQIGGTSLSAPLWGGLMAIANQGRSLLGLNPLDGVSQTLPRLYSLNGSDFHDVTSGSNGSFSAAAGYDLVTGRGTPIANQLIPDLAGGATIGGTVFNDANGNGSRDSGESYIPNTTLYLDLNNNGAKDTSEPTSVTSSAGAYSFGDLLGRVSYTVREVTPSGYTATTPLSLTLSSLYGTTTTGDFGLAGPPQTSFNGKSLTLRLDSTKSKIEVYNATSATGTPAYTINKSAVTALTFAGTSGDDSFTLDLSNGNPVAGLDVTYGGGTGTDTVVVRGTAAANTAVFSNTGITADGGTLSTTLTESATFDGRGGDDSVTDNGTNPLTLSAGQRLTSLTLGVGARATLPAGRNTLYTRALSVGTAATLDVTDGNLIVDDPAGAMTSVRSSLTSGYAAGLWSGTGIVSSTAANDATRMTALGYLTAGDLGVSTYAGQDVSANAVIVRYTYYGDATLNGKVDSDDLALTDRGRVFGKSGWLYGDFSYDGLTNSADYTLMQQPLAQSPELPVIL